MAQKRGFMSVPTSTVGDYVKVADHVEIFDPRATGNEGHTHEVRLIYEPDTIGKEVVHWLYKPAPAGATKPFIARSFNCPDYDHDTMSMRTTGAVCPICKCGHRPQGTVYANAIIRAYQEAMPAKIIQPSDAEYESGFKDVAGGSKAWTPIRVVKFTDNDMRKVNNVSESNYSIDPDTKQRVAFDVSDEVFGRDIFIKYNPKEQVAANKFTVSGGNSVNCIEQDEMEYLRQRVDSRVLFPPASVSSMLKFLCDEASPDVYSNKMMEDKHLVDTSAAWAIKDGEDGTQPSRSVAAVASRQPARSRTVPEESLDDEAPAAPSRARRAAPVEEPAPAPSRSRNRAPVVEEPADEPAPAQAASTRGRGRAAPVQVPAEVQAVRALDESSMYEFCTEMLLSIGEVPEVQEVYAEHGDVVAAPNGNNVVNVTAEGIHAHMSSLADDEALLDFLGRDEIPDDWYDLVDQLKVSVAAAAALIEVLSAGEHGDEIDFSAETDLEVTEQEPIPEPEPAPAPRGRGRGRATAPVVEEPAEEPAPAPAASRRGRGASAAAVVEEAPAQRTSSRRAAAPAPVEEDFVDDAPDDNFEPPVRNTRSRRAPPNVQFDD